MLIETNIPIYKAQHLSFRNFMSEFAGRELLDKSTSRKTYLKRVYAGTIAKIRLVISEDRIWTSVDGTTDAKGQFVGYTIVASLNLQEPPTTFLISSVIVERTNHSTVAQVTAERYSSR